jgi:hypothetical protein
MCVNLLQTWFSDKTFFAMHKASARRALWGKQLSREKWGLTILSQGANRPRASPSHPTPVDRTVCPHFSPRHQNFPSGALWGGQSWLQPTFRRLFLPRGNKSHPPGVKGLQ